ncbi:UDP-glycosyltransferase 73C4 [Capsicum annuum]|nr:UDP-glycosyltransferase 73C4 [Capsicum annuum]
MYYIGKDTESVETDVVCCYNMAVGGDGIVISYPLAMELIKILDGCINHYHYLFASDQNIASCIAEIGFLLTKELSFHQIHVRGPLSSIWIKFLGLKMVKRLQVIAKIGHDSNNQYENQKYKSALAIHIVNVKAPILSPKVWRQTNKQSQDLARGTLINTFEELESWYVDAYKKVVKKVCCVGPLSLCNKEIDEMVDRGNKASIDEHICLNWLDSMEPKSVIYVCFGSLCNISFLQMKEIGLGLESSNVAFIWIIRGLDFTLEVEKWLRDVNFEERVKGRGMIIKGWAPQVMILSHPSVGGFLTHCGWNSTLEGISSGVPMITFPMFAEQFYNEKFIVNVLKTGVRVGVEVSNDPWNEEKNGVPVNKDRIKKAIDQLMDKGFESEERRKRAK